MKRNEPAIRHAFDQTATRLARLILFSEMGESREVSYEVTFRQEQLATDDVLSVAIACRRLIDALALRDFSFARKILSHSKAYEWKGTNPRPDDLSLHETINRIVHSSIVELYSFSYQLQTNLSVEVAYEAAANREKYRIPPILAVKSDRDNLAFCDLKDLCLAIDEVLQLAIDTAGEMRIYIGES